MTAYYDQQSEPLVGSPPHRAVCRYCCAEVEHLQRQLAGRVTVAEEIERRRAVVTERDEARAEVERLRADYERMWSALQAETTTSVQVRGELRAEIKRLRGTLTVVADAAELLASKMMIEGTRGHQIAQNIVVSARQALSKDKAN